MYWCVTYFPERIYLYSGVVFKQMHEFKKKSNYATRHLLKRVDSKIRSENISHEKCQLETNSYQRYLLIILYAKHAFCLHMTHQWRSDNKSKKAKQVQSRRALRIQNTKNVMPKTTKVIYAWDKKVLCIWNNSHFLKQQIYEHYRIIDIHVNTTWAGDTLGEETSTSSGIKQ